MDRYLNRQEAGKVLAHELRHYEHDANALILALPRGGVPVAFEIAKAYHTPLDIFIVRKLGVPGHSELAMGAIAPFGTQVFNREVISDLDIPKAAIQRVIAREEKELKRREIAYRGERPFPDVKGKTIILVDDGIATGATIRVAIKALRQLQVGKLVVAIPVAQKELVAELKPLVDDLICPLTPSHFYAVGAWYIDFEQTEDEEVTQLLKDARQVAISNAHG